MKPVRLAAYPGREYASKSAAGLDRPAAVKRTSIAALRLARRIAEQPALRKLIVREVRPGPEAQSDEALLEHIARLGATSYHPIGTCKMGTDPMAVVDHELKVRGIRGLRVADASIMPTMVSSNTNASSFLIGERCADLLLRDAGDNATPERLRADAVGA